MDMSPSHQTHSPIGKKKVADNSPNSMNCYVCGFIPHSTKEELPLISIQFHQGTLYMSQIYHKLDHYTARNFTQICIPVTLLTLSPGPKTLE